LIVLDKGKIAFDDSPDCVFQHIQELHRLGVGAPVEIEMQPLLKA
jgi:hypothetical protein